MPCQPRQIGLGKYCLPATLNRMECEEDAARVLMHSKDLDRWVGVSWPRLMEVMKADFELHMRWMAVQDHNYKATWAHHRAKRAYTILAICTLGLSLLFKKKPVLTLKEAPAEKPVFTGITMQGPGFVGNGVLELVEQEMLKRVSVGEGEEAKDVLFPTAKLLLRIMEVQKVSIQPA